MCDVEQMYQRLHVDTVDHNYICILWWKKVDFNRLFSWLRKLHVEASNQANYHLYPKCSQFVMMDFYIRSFQTSQNAIHLFKEARELWVV